MAKLSELPVKIKVRQMRCGKLAGVGAYPYEGKSVLRVPLRNLSKEMRKKLTYHLMIWESIPLTDFHVLKQEDPKKSSEPTIFAHAHDCFKFNILQY